VFLEPTGEFGSLCNGSGIEGIISIVGVDGLRKVLCGDLVICNKRRGNVSSSGARIKEGFNVVNVGRGMSDS
jgi:hypothetical protein